MAKISKFYQHLKIHIIDFRKLGLERENEVHGRIRNHEKQTLCNNSNGIQLTAILL